MSAATCQAAKRFPRQGEILHCNHEAGCSVSELSHQVSIPSTRRRAACKRPIDRKDSYARTILDHLCVSTKGFVFHSISQWQIIK
jgi:hypothetical protein